MPGDARQLSGAKIKLWCVAASRAPVVAVVARVYDDGHSTGVLRWNWRDSAVELGAYTSMELAAHRCRLSPDGEFLFYHATGGPETPFPGFFGGAFAISRLPWLAALTDPRQLGPLGGCFSSRDALPDDQQQRLWKMFDSWPAFVMEEHWPLHLGDAWRAASVDDVNARGSALGPAHLAAATDVCGTTLRLYAIVRSRPDKWGNPLWDLWHDDLRFFMGPANCTAGALRELEGVRWASPAEGGRVLVATADAKLRVLRCQTTVKDTPVLTIQQEHDLGGLTPAPGPAPRWAKAALSS